MTTTTKKIKSDQLICGHCLGASVSTEGVRAHRRCKGQCACGDVGHKFDRQMADRMAVYCHVDIDQVYRAHGRKRRVLTDEQRAAAVERLRAGRDPGRRSDPPAPEEGGE